MVFKKYIKRKGKVYGPYLYENKRVNGKIITSYLGQAQDKEPRGKTKIFSYFLSVLVLILLFSVIILNFYPSYEEVITGNVGHEGQENAGAYRAVSSLDEGESIMMSAGNGALIGDPPIVIDIIKSFDLEGRGLVVIRPPKVFGTPVAGKLVEWRLPIEVVDASNVKDIRVRIPNAQSVSVLSDVGFVQTGSSSIILEDIFFGESLNSIDFKIKNPVIGEYEIVFFLPGPRVDEKVISNGKIVEVGNPFGVSYKGVSVIVGLDFELTDSSDLKVFSLEREEIDYKLFDADGDDKPDFISFSTDIGARSTVYYDILFSGVEKIETKVSGEKRIIASGIDFESLTEECKTGLICNSYMACSYSFTSNAFMSEAPLTGRQAATCVSENLNCPPIIIRERSCSTTKKIVASPVEEKSEIYFGPSEIVEAEEVEEKHVSIYDAETESEVVSIVVKAKKVDIVFTQQSESIGFSPPTSCYDGVQDNGEEGVDCGGDCRVCLAQSEIVFPWIWWSAFILLAAIFAYLERNKSFRIKGYLYKGKKTLSKGNLKRSIYYYKLMRNVFYDLKPEEKRAVKQKSLHYYLSLKNALEKKKVKVEHSKKFKGLPSLAFTSKHFVFNEISGSNVSRIKKLIEDGIESLEEGHTKAALVNYRTVRQIYEKLSDKEKREARRRCNRYYGKVKRHLTKRNFKFKAERGFMPEIQIFRSK